MRRVCLHDRDEIAGFLRGNVHLHAYGLGDLDDYFWPHTTWYGLKDGDELRALILMYSGLSLATLLALGDDELRPLRGLLEAALPLLPATFYAHLSPGLAPCLESAYALKPHGEHLKMALKDASRLDAFDTSAVAGLSPADGERALAFFGETYPGHWFEPQMLDTGQYFAVSEDGALACVAGVHVYSPRYKVAALGNIATHPDRRGRGLAAAATAALCRNLLETVTHICLNVKADNRAAIRCYEKLGFETVASYEEYSAKLK